MPTERINCGCWTNPDTGYLEACSKHDPVYMDLMMETEKRRKTEAEVARLTAELAEARKDTERLSEACVIALRTIKRSSTPEQKDWSINRIKELMKGNAARQQQADPQEGNP